MKETKKENNTLIIVFIAILAIFLIGGISGYGMMGFGGCPMFGLGYSSTFGMIPIFSSIISILITIAIVIFIIWLVKQIQEKK